MTRLRSALVLAALGTVATTAPAHAYVDPGSGSILVTSILGMIAAASFTARSWIARARAYLRGEEPQAGTDADRQG